MSPHETPKPRTAFVERNTKETSIQVSLSLDGQSLDRLPHDDRFAAAVSTRGQKIKNQDDEAHHAVQFSTSQTIWVWTGIGFLDHMLHAMAKHAGWSLRLRCRGDLSIDDHHTAEDTFLALGSAVSQALGARAGIRRFGDAFAPLDEALALAVVDISGRAYYAGDFGFRDQKIGDLTAQMVPHCLRSFSQTAGVTLHIELRRGENDHHRAEAAFKALALALREACARVVGREGEVPSTKGTL